MEEVEDVRTEKRGVIHFLHPVVAVQVGAQKHFGQRDSLTFWEVYSFAFLHTLQVLWF